jgi:hypothetical protein
MLFDIGLAIFIALSAIGAIAYGYVGYNQSKNRKYLKWIYVGGFCIIVVILNLTTADFFTLNPPVSDIFHWMRLICDIAVAVLGFILAVGDKP